MTWAKSETGHRPRILVAGIGESGPVERDDRAIPEIVLEAVEAALVDAGIGFDEIDSAVTASVDLDDGLTASNIAITEVVGAVMGPETRIAGDSLGALAHAACQLWAGAYRTVLVVAHGKASIADQDSISRWTLDPVSLQQVGLSDLAIAGLQAQMLLGSDDGAEVRWAQRAAELRGCDAADVLASTVIASPLRALMAAPDADAAVAVVLRVADPHDTDRAPQMLDAVALTGVGFDLDAHEPGDRDLRSWVGLTRALDRALAVADPNYQPAESSRPVFGVVEASFRFPHEEELFEAAAGQRATDNPYASGLAPVAAGLGRFAAATKALRTRPGRALAHGTWGPAGQAHAVAVLERPAGTGETP